MDVILEIVVNKIYLESQANNEIKFSFLSFQILQSSKEQIIMSVPIHIVIKTLSGRIIELDVENDALIADVKRMIQDEEGIAFDRQRLIFDDQELIDDKSLSDYKIADQSTLHLFPRRHHKRLPEL